MEVQRYKHFECGNAIKIHDRMIYIDLYTVFLRMDATNVCEWFLVTVTTLALGLFVLYESFPRLTAGLGGCAYY